MPAPATLTTAEVAALAHVQRPVVTVWRRRFARSEQPFPEPLVARGPGNSFLFDAAQVIRWLAVTGHGNNAEAEADLAMHARSTVDGAELPLAQLSALVGLLCLKATTGEVLAGQSVPALLDLADESDPDDELLYRELAGAGDALPALAASADDLADAAYSAAGALETIVLKRMPRVMPGQERVAVTGAVLDFAAGIAGAVLDALGTNSVVLPRGAGAGPVANLCRSSTEERVVEVFAEPDDGTGARAARCLLAAHRVLRNHRPAASAASLAVAMFPPPDAPSMSDLHILTAVDGVAEQLRENRYAVVLGPASALAEPVKDRRSSRVRSDLIRAGQLLVVLRLPRGLLLGRSREALALWILGPARHHVPVEQKRSFVADLLDEQLSDTLLQQMGADLLHALRPDAGRRVWGAYLRPVLTRQLLTVPGSLVELSPAARPVGLTAQDVLVEVGRTDLLAKVGLPPLVPAEPPGLPAAAALGASIAARRLRVIAGTRLRPADVLTGPRGGACRPVIGPAELLAGRAQADRWMDPLDLGRYPQARLTEPGDVVFCTAPRPTAVVDDEGGSVVAYPARVLRVLDDDRLLPALVAQDINRQPAHARNWRRWAMREVPAGLAAPSREALVRLATARGETLARLRALEMWENCFTDAVTSGLVTIDVKGR